LKSDIALKTVGIVLGSIFLFQILSYDNFEITNQFEIQSKILPDAYGHIAKHQTEDANIWVFAHLQSVSITWTGPNSFDKALGMNPSDIVIYHRQEEWRHEAFVMSEKFVKPMGETGGAQTKCYKTTLDGKLKQVSCGATPDRKIDERQQFLRITHGEFPDHEHYTHTECEPVDYLDMRAQLWQDNNPFSDPDPEVDGVADLIKQKVLDEIKGEAEGQIKGALVGKAAAKVLSKASLPKEAAEITIDLISLLLGSSSEFGSGIQFYPLDFEGQKKVYVKTKGADGFSSFKYKLTIVKVPNAKTFCNIENVKTVLYNDDVRSPTRTCVATAGADLRGCNMAGLTLSDMDLSHTVMTGADLSEADLSNTNLSGSDLSNTNLALTNFQNGNLEDVNLVNSQIKHANFRGATLIASDFRGAQIADSDFTEIVGDGSDWRGADIHDSNFVHASLLVTEFGGADIINNDFSGSNVQTSDFEGANVDGNTGIIGDDTTGDTPVDDTPSDTPVDDTPSDTPVDDTNGDDTEPEPVFTIDVLTAPNWAWVGEEFEVTFLVTNESEEQHVANTLYFEDPVGPVKFSGDQDNDSGFLIYTPVSSQFPVVKFVCDTPGDHSILGARVHYGSDGITDRADHFVDCRVQDEGGTLPPKPEPEPEPEPSTKIDYTDYFPVLAPCLIIESYVENGIEYFIGEDCSMTDYPDKFVHTSNGITETMYRNPNTCEILRTLEYLDGTVATEYVIGECSYPYDAKIVFPDGNIIDLWGYCDKWGVYDASGHLVPSC